MLEPGRISEEHQLKILRYFLGVLYYNSTTIVDFNPRLEWFIKTRWSEAKLAVTCPEIYNQLFKPISLALGIEIVKNKDCLWVVDCIFPKYIMMTNFCKTEKALYGAA